MKQNFKASVQYDDWKGTAAADDADQNDFRDYLRGKNLMTDDEFLIGVEVWVGENADGKVEKAFVHALIMADPSYDDVEKSIQKNGYAKVRKVDLDMSIEKLVSFFKRFSISLSAHDLLSGKQYEVQ